MNTSELKERALDWAAAKAKGVALLDPYNNEWELCWTLLADNSGDYYAPSTDWAQGGPIIEREGIFVRPKTTGGWRCWIYDGKGEGIKFDQHGPTPLIAAMRCYVASKMGDTVEIPEELI
jgi:hypothetical protein